MLYLWLQTAVRRRDIQQAIVFFGQASAGYQQVVKDSALNQVHGEEAKKRLEKLTEPEGKYASIKLTS